MATKRTQRAAAAIDVSAFTERWRPLDGVIAQIQRQNGLVIGQPEAADSRIERLLDHRLGQLAIDVGAYAARCARDPVERLLLLDLLQLRRSAWFPGPGHFQHFEQRIVPAVAGRFVRTSKPVIRIWCASTGTGEEAYSIASVLERALPGRPRWDATILATDWSLSALEYAQVGHYERIEIAALDAGDRARLVRESSGARPRFSIRPEVRRDVHFAWLDINGPWAFAGPFDAVFCHGLIGRIDARSCERAIERIAAMLPAGAPLYASPGDEHPAFARHFRAVAGPGIHLR
ncbi:MAG: hypothetical protein H0W83_10410 [Planctomycetes bacterium]|nr:hypothetical protein [Planctomycetota bacterium]